MKAYAFLSDLMHGEDGVKCFLCTRVLRPMRWHRALNRVLFFWLRQQFVVGFVRNVNKGEEGYIECEDRACNCNGDEPIQVVFEITVCEPCGWYANQHPLEAELLAKARLASIQKGEEHDKPNAGPGNHRA